MRIYFLVGSRMQDKQLKCSYLILNPNITLGLPYLDELKKLKTPKTINIINYSKEASIIL